jgi:PTS system N-acetylglucosamine-specific IIC component
MAGFFPVMMFGLPAACLAMYRTATPENRIKVGSLLLSAALVSLVTGITEPIEFSFMFAAPALYAVHALLTGLSMVVMNLLHVKLGFTFSAGTLDYVLSYGKSQHGWLALPVGVVYFGLYYGIFTVCIRKFNFKTLGREPLALEGETDAEAILPVARTRAHGYIQALGGIDNILELEACATRLRVSVKNSKIVLDPALKAAGAMGVVRPSDDNIQVVIGPIADAVADEINAEIRATRLAAGDALAASHS